jgi:hypothetical protein
MIAKGSKQATSYQPRNSQKKPEYPKIREIRVILPDKAPSGVLKKHNLASPEVGILNRRS